MAGEQKVNVLLPRRFNRARRYPVLYLLHGAGGNYTGWVQRHGVARLIGAMPVIAVMPDGAAVDASGQRRNGGYSDWFGVEAGMPGPAFAWESYHIRELVPFIDARFPTRAGAAGRAIAGISMGGGGAMKYAAAFPGTFGYAASFSGSLAHGRESDNPCVRGDPALQEVVWRDNSAIDLAGNLRGVRMFVRSGDGTAGPLDPPRPADPAQAAVWERRLRTEAGAHGAAQGFLGALDDAGIRAVDAELYPGSHFQPYWQRELPELFAWLRAQLRRPVVAPVPFSVSTARTAFTAWGWSFRAHRGVREFAYLRVGRDALSVTGSGRLDVVTPARYRPRSAHRVRTGGRTRRVAADRRGRLSFSVDLGPSHTAQQTSFGPGATSGWRTVTTRIR